MLEQDRRVHHVRANDLLRPQPVHGEQHHPDQRPAARGAQADDEAGRRADDDRRDLVLRMHLEVVALLDLLGEEASQERCGTDHEQAGGEDGKDRLVELVAELTLEDVEDPDAQDRHRHAPDCHPVDERHVDRLQLQVAPTARRLGDRGLGDVGADRGGRFDAEDEDQQGGHEGTATHPGHADQETHAEAEENDLWVYEN